MKKFLVMAAMVLSSVGAFAQYKAGDITIQPKVGFNASNVTHADGADFKAGLLIGAEAEFHFQRWFGLSVGAMYSQQGYKFKDAAGNHNANMDYLAVPVLANFYVAKGLALKTGLQPSFNVNSTNGWNVNTVDLSLPMGISYEFNGFCFDARYNLGLTDVFKNDARDYSDAAKHEVLSFTFGYKFKL